VPNASAAASAAEYALAVDKEHRWLPALAPGSRCRFPYRWRRRARHGLPVLVVGLPMARRRAAADRIADPVRFAVDLAGFLTALRSIDPPRSRPGKHNWFRGGTLRTYDGETQSALTALDATSMPACTGDLKTALDARWDVRRAVPR